MSNTYLSVGLRLNGRKCLLVGGGTVAYRKAKALVEKGADLTVIAPEHNAGIHQFAEDNRLTLIDRVYESSEVQDYGLVVCATNDENVNQIVYDDCVRARVPVNVADDPDRCDFIFPAVIQRGSLSLAISTDGHAPFLTAHIRQMLESAFGPHWRAVADLAEAFRAEVRQRFGEDQKKQQECFQKFLATDWPGLFMSAEPAGVEEHYRELLKSL